MALVLMATHPWGTLWDSSGNIQPGEQAAFTNVDDATAVTHYADADASSPSTGPVTADADGRLMRWVAEDSYDMELPDATVLQVEATSGRTLRTVESNVDAITVLATASIYAGLDPSGVADSTTALQSFFDDAATRGRLLIPEGTFKFTNLTIPSTGGDEGGCIIEGAGRKRTTLICTASSGFGITFGDSGTYTTIGQEIRNLTIEGNANCAGAVKFFGTRDCAIRKCYIHGFTNASAVAVLFDSADHNYFNEIEGCWFENSRAHIKLLGAGGIGGNSNYIFHNHFETPSAGGSYAIIIDGGATNRITENEFGSAMAVGVRIEDNANAINNQLSQNQFDGPTKAWEIAGANVDDTDLWGNKGAAAIVASTDLGSRTTQHDSLTEQARVSVYHDSTQSVTGIATLVFNQVSYDPSGMHVPGATSDLTAQLAGVYHVMVNIDYVAGAAGDRMVRVCKNGTAIIVCEKNAPFTDVGNVTTVDLAFDIALAAGDFLRVRGYQESGGALNVAAGNGNRAQFQMRRVG